MSSPIFAPDGVDIIARYRILSPPKRAAQRRLLSLETVGYLKGRFLPAYAESPGRQLVDECEERVPSEALAKEGMLRRVTPKHG